jgi:protein O-mannosyl-transferase
MQTTQHAEDPGTADWRVTWRMGFLVTAFAVLAFLPALACGFVIPDDRQNFLSNLALDCPWGQKLAWAWTTRFMDVYQPLWWMLVMAEHAAWGLKPMGYHAVSLALHAAVAAALFAFTLAVLRRVTPGAKGHAAASAAIAAGLASLLFCVHPLRTEMVVWLSAQPHLPSILCMVLGVLAYLNANQADRTPRNRLGWLVGSFLLGSAAMFFKTSAVAFPFILLVLDWYPLGRLTLDLERPWPWPSRRAWRAVVEKAPLLALSGVMMAVTRWARPNPRFVSGELVAAPLSARLADAALVVWFYPYKTIVPSRLAVFYTRTDASLVHLTEPRYALCAAAVLAACVFAWVMRRRCPGFTAAWLAYLIILAPNSGLVRFLPGFAADRYSYAASLPWVVLLAGGLAWAVRERRWAGTVCWAVVGPLAIGLSISSWYQTATWRHSLALWNHALESGQGQSVFAQIDLGEALDEKGRGNEALDHYITAVELAPNSSYARVVLALSLTHLGNRDAAIHELQEFLRNRQDDPQACYALGNALMVAGEYDQAVVALRAALQPDPDLFEAHRDLGVILALRGDREEAIAALRAALRIQPDDPQVKANLALLLADRAAEIQNAGPTGEPALR